jgi:hypothetical protein
LHGFWDGLLGKRRNARKLLNLTIQIQSEQPRGSLDELKQATRFVSHKFVSGIV